MFRVIPREWIAGLKFTRDLLPEALIPAASRPVVGKDNVRETLQGYLDGASFVLDQSLRGILGGKGPDELRHLVRFPKYLDEMPFNLQVYGEIYSYSPAIYYQVVGWNEMMRLTSNGLRRATKPAASWLSLADAPRCWLPLLML